MWFGKEPKQKPKPIEPKLITFRADDPPYARARKIWESLGFANDRFNSIPSISGYLAMYREWDREAAEKGVRYLEVEEDE